MSDFNFDTSQFFADMDSYSNNMNNYRGAMSGIQDQILALNLMATQTDARAKVVREAGEVAAQGSLLVATGLREQAGYAKSILQFNLATDKLNTQRQLDAQARQAHRTIGAQIAQISQAGVSVGSKSALIARNEIVGDFGTLMLNTRIDAENKKRADTFETDMLTSNLESQAKAQEYQASISRWEASVKSADMINSFNSYASGQQLGLNRQLASANTILSDY